SGGRLKARRADARMRLRRDDPGMTWGAADRENQKNARQRAGSPPLDGELPRRPQAGDVEGDRRSQHRGAVRTDPGEPSAEAAPEAACPIEFRIGAATPSRLAACQE